MGKTGVNVRPNSIRVTFTLDGRQRHQTLVLNGTPMAPTPANIKYAERLAAEIREKIRLGMFSLVEYFPASGDTQAQATVGDQLDKWLNAQRIESSTRAGYSSGVKFWKEHPPEALGSKPIAVKALRALKRSDVLTAIASRPDLTGKTINNYVQVLREALELAVDDGDLKENPVAKIPPAKHQKEPPDPFSRDEASQIVASVHANHPGQVANFTEFWVWTGMRTSEIFGLKWEKVDLASGSVLVDSAVVRGESKQTKTNVARTVRLNSMALAAITRQKAYTYLAGGPVFHDPRCDTPWVDERAYRRSFWTPTLKRLGIRYRRPYNLRHTYATIMLMAGMNHSFCAKQLGHSVEMFQRTYTKWISGQQDDAEMGRLEATMPGLCPEMKKGT